MALHNLYKTPQWLRPGSGISFVFRGSDEAMEITTSAGGAVTRPQDFAATAGTGAEDTASLNSWIAETGLKYLPNGDYLASGSVSAFPHPTLILADDASESGTKLPFISIGSLPFKNLPPTYMFIRQLTTDRTDPFTVRIERIVDSDVGYGVPQALRVWTQKNHSNSNTEFVISGILDNYSDTASNGDACVSGVSNKYGTAAAFSGHFQMNDMVKRSADTAVTASPAVEMNIQAIGLDHPTANANLGYRRVLDIIAKTNYGVDGWNTATDNYGEAEIGQGIVIRNDDGGGAGRNGYFRYGLAIVDMPSNTNPISTAVYIKTNGGKGIELAGNVTGSQIVVQGSSSYGLVLNGSYSQTAIRVNTGQSISVNTTNTIKTAYGTTANIWGFYDTTSERVGFDMTASPHIRVAGTKVVGARDTGWTAMTGTPDESTAYATGTVTLAQLAGRVMALQTALTTHGLIGA